MTPQNWVLPVFLGFLAIAFMGFLFSQYKEKKIISILSTISAIAAMFLLLSANSLFGEPTGRYQYIAHIDDTVSMSEFHEKYELISVNDDVYCFKDKITEEKEIK